MQTKWEVHTVYGREPVEIATKLTELLNRIEESKLYIVSVNGPYPMAIHDQVVKDRVFYESGPMTIKALSTFSAFVITKKL